MKRFAGLILAAAVAVSMVGTVCGTETAQDTVMSTIETENFTFRISETIDSNNTIVRTYSPDNAAAESVSGNLADSEEMIESVLLALGMEQDDIDMLSSDDLEDYLSSEYIVSSVSYSKTDNETGEVEYVDETTALTESAKINADRLEKFMGGVSTTEVDTYEDSYMKINFVVSYFGDGEYYYRNISKWLTMPYFRGKDIVSICTMTGTVEDGTRGGYYNYNKNYFIPSQGYNETFSYKENFSSSDFTNVINGNWYGTGVVVNLPSDIATSSSTISYLNYKVTVYYRGYISTPTIERYFNTTASYSHSTFSVYVTGFSIGVSSSGASAAIEFTGATFKDTRSAGLLIHYIP
ncbi:MAG: hypothetical protein LUG88_07270 [Clostridia bacterium]|nr:hypothetical protein [Clostridia bacterium]